MNVSLIKETISFEEFAKRDIRVGISLQVAEVLKSNKLMKLMLDFSDHTRSILFLASPSCLARRYRPGQSSRRIEPQRDPARLQYCRGFDV